MEWRPSPAGVHSPTIVKTRASRARSTKKPASRRSLSTSARNEVTEPDCFARIKIPSTPIVRTPIAAARWRPSFSSINTWSAWIAIASRSDSISPASRPESSGGNGAQSGRVISFSQPSCCAADKSLRASESSKAESSRVTPDGMITSPNCSRNNSSRPMIARFESGEVSLTTSIREVCFQFGRRVVPGNSPPTKFLTKGDPRQAREFRRMA